VFQALAALACYMLLISMHEIASVGLYYIGLVVMGAHRIGQGPIERDKTDKYIVCFI